MSRRSLIYLAHPVSGDVAANLARARRWLLWCYRTRPDLAFVSQWILDCEILDDANPADRALGLEHGFAIIERCDEIWRVGGRISYGMALEGAHGAEHGVRLVDMTAIGEEPPVP